MLSGHFGDVECKNKKDKVNKPREVIKMVLSLSAQKSLQRDSSVSSVHYHLPYLGQSMQEILVPFAESCIENPAASHLFIYSIDLYYHKSHIYDFG